MAYPISSSRPAPDSAFMLQQLFTAILWVDEGLFITWLNPQAEQLLAISSGRLLNKSILNVLAPDELKENSNYNLHNDDLHNDGLNTDITSDTDETCPLTERFIQAQQYQQPFIDHDHTIRLPMNGGASITVDYSVTPVIYEQQTYFIIEMWGKDRQSRISEEQRQQQQYNVARHMLRSVAHEIKNPLAGIRGAAQLLQRQFTKFSDMTAPDHVPNDKNQDTAPAITDPNIRTTAKKLRAYTDIIISETDRLTQLIGQLLGSNQLPNWQALNIHEPIEHVLTLVLSHYSQIQSSLITDSPIKNPLITVQRDYDLSLPELRADKDQLIQVFLNLINNACEAMIEHQQTITTSDNPAKAINTQTHINYPQHGDQQGGNYQPKLHIQTRVIFQHTIGSRQHKQVVQITITDNGCGIDPALIGQIFFPMVTSRASGTGLGLAIVQDIINQHHGMIDVSSVRGQTRFTVYLPFNSPAYNA
ncbi:two-component system nitrogen regulation sensor histidine kinase GlnL [Psychrobacter sp. PL19]|uniref:two-component system sensor histidine kinase NtrB n=1 Tax=Psychrobacter sp. PL19 TaxID=2760711 RepID=UPI001AE1A214